MDAKTWPCEDPLNRRWKPVHTSNTDAHEVTFLIWQVVLLFLEMDESLPISHVDRKYCEYQRHSFRPPSDTSRIVKIVLINPKKRQNQSVSPGRPH